MYYRLQKKRPTSRIPFVARISLSTWQVTRGRKGNGKTESVDVGGQG